MKAIYCICREVNDKGFYNSDKTFSNKIDAISYLRKLVARMIIDAREKGCKIMYLNDYKPDLTTDIFPKTIEFGYIDDDYNWARFDFRVNGITLFENQSEFSKYPVQF
jgi:hypothetical protein